MLIFESPYRCFKRSQFGASVLTNLFIRCLVSNTEIWNGATDFSVATAVDVQLIVLFL